MNVTLTNKAKEKGFRLLTNGRLKQVVEDMDGKLYRERGEENRYLLIHKDPVEDEVWIHFVVEGDEIVVITQRHPHGDSPTNDSYENVSKHKLYTDDELGFDIHR